MGLVKKEYKREHRTHEIEKRRYNRDCEGLRSQLLDPDPAVRRWAVKDIVKCPGASKILGSLLHQEDVKDVREAIFSALINIKDKIAIEYLIGSLRSGDADLRNQAIDALKEANEIEIVHDLLKDPDPDIRIFAINILESSKHPETEEWLVNIITTDNHVNVCATAADLLAEIGTEYSLDALYTLKERFIHEPYIQFVTNLVIERIKNE